MKDSEYEAVYKNYDKHSDEDKDISAEERNIDIIQMKYKESDNDETYL